MSEEAAPKPNVLILGGVGFIGRNLVKYLIDNSLVGFIRVADKKMPATSQMHPSHKAYFDDKKMVHFKQSDLSRQAMAAKCFTFDDKKIDYVINLCGETRQALPDVDYQEKIVKTAVTTAPEAIKHGVKKWVEVSHAWVYAGDKKVKTEDGKTAPWTKQGTQRLVAEQKLREMTDLPMVVLRPAVVYGPGDLGGLCPRICSAATYKKTNKTMEMLHGASLKLNTVHVEDLCAAIWVACTEAAAGTTYNVADAGDTTQGTLNAILGTCFDIKTGFFGAMINAVANKALPTVASQSNNRHIPAWNELCNDHKIRDTPVSPYLDVELITANHVAVDGTKITRDTSFRYQKPALTEALIREQVQFQIDQGIFPPVLSGVSQV